MDPSSYLSPASFGIPSGNVHLVVASLPPYVSIITPSTVCWLCRPGLTTVSRKPRKLMVWFWIQFLCGRGLKNEETTVYSPRKRQGRTLGIGWTNRIVHYLCVPLALLLTRSTKQPMVCLGRKSGTSEHVKSVLGRSPPPHVTPTNDHERKQGTRHKLPQAQLEP